MDGESFAEFQRIPSRWAYNWHAFQAGGEFFVAHAEHAGPSVLYRWDGKRLQPWQTLADESGRAFATFGDGGETYLVVACIAAPTRVLRLGRTAVHADPGPRRPRGQGAGRGPVRGPDAAHPGQLHPRHPRRPRPALDSQVYEWDGGKLHEVATFPTCGGTDVAVLNDATRQRRERRSVELIVTNSLTPELRFAAETVRYELSAGAR